MYQLFIAGLQVIFTALEEDISTETDGEEKLVGDLMELTLFIVLLCIFITSFIFSMFGRGGGDFYLPIILTFLPINYYTAAGISLFLIVVQGLSMTLIYHKKHRLIDWKLAIILGSIIALSSFLGGVLSYKIPEIYLKLSFSCFLLISSYLLYRNYNLTIKYSRIGLWKREAVGITYTVNLLYIVFPVLLASFMASMSGISGGGLIIPICTLFGGVPLRIAMGTNTFLVLISSSMGFIGHLTRGGFDLSLGIKLVLMVILGSQLGSRIHIKIKEEKLRKGFSIILVIAALWMLIKIFI